MDGTFIDLNVDFEIISEKQLEKDEYIDNTESIQLDFSQLMPVKNKIDVLQISDVKTSNDFLNHVQQNESKKREAEIKRVKSADADFPYIKNNLLTDAEKQLYRFMTNYLDKKEYVVIFPKVRLADLIQVDNKITTSKNPFYKIASKHVDYVICRNDTLEIVCVVELDDYTHDTKEARERDLFIMQALYTAGIDVIRIKVPIKTICKEDLNMLDEKINTVLAPNCPYCGIKMVPKKSMRRDNKGHRFYSCPNFIVGCRYTIDIDLKGEKLP